MEAKQRALSARLIKLGDMMGDGLHLEPDGKWIEREYASTMKALGFKRPSKPRRNNSVLINEFMSKATQEFKCKKCSGVLQQTRKGSMRAKCVQCSSVFVMGRVIRKRAA